MIKGVHIAEFRSTHSSNGSKNSDTFEIEMFFSNQLNRIRYPSRTEWYPNNEVYILSPQLYDLYFEKKKRNLIELRQPMCRLGEKVFVPINYFFIAQSVEVI